MSYSPKHNDAIIRIKIDNTACEIDIDLSVPMIIPVRGVDKNGKEIIWHLKVTEKRRLVLL